jgi:5-formyltetrahydrofolate cyclo-ligase
MRKHEPRKGDDSLRRRKAELRREIATVLETVPREDKIRRCSGLFDEISALRSFRQADHVLAYLPMDDELPLLPLWERIADSGRRLYLPAIDSGTMEFLAWENADPALLVAGAFGISRPEPGAEGWTGKLAPRSLVIVPGLAFSSDGMRLGRGGGFYDEFLVHYKELASIAICLSEQVRERIPAEEHDAAVGRVIIL